MRLRVLGEMEVRGSEGWLPVRALKQRMLLATLLLGRGSPVSIERLIDQLWPDEQPRDPANQVHLLVSRLRRLFGADGSEVIQTVRPGYLLTLAPEGTDADRFEQLAEQGSRALGKDQPEQAVDALAEGVALWRGPAYTDALSCAAVAAEAERLEQVRLAVLEARLDAELRLGRHATVAGELRGLVDDHPFRERLSALLMLALYRSGRQADALEAYQRAYRRLDEELGVQPGPELQDLHQRMLQGDPALGPAVENAAAATKPAQLPTDLSSMTGRRAELEGLLALADRGGHRPGAVVISAIDGMAGIGKTALAVHVAHKLAGKFPDGQVFLDLHGFTHGLAPLSPATALDRLLRSIGVSGEEIPDTVESRAALWRTRLAGKQLLLLLDNAASESQVQPLLPAGSGCLVIVTSRHRLGDLDDAVPVSLDVLSASDAVALFYKVAGPGRLDRETAELVGDAVDLCGRLPLAIRLLASRLRKRSAWRLADLLERLRDDRARVIELDTGRRSVAAAFGVSYEQLDDEQRRVFRLLGQHPGADFDAYAAAALADLDVSAAERVLEGLVDVHLLQLRSYARYAFHDLLRAYAADIARQEDSRSDRVAATDRLLDYYAYTVSKAVDAYAPARRHFRLRVPPVPASVPDFGAAEDRALAWLDAERTNLVAATEHAVVGGRPMQACRLSRLLSRYVRNGAYNSDAKTLYEHHLLAARAEGNRTEEALALWLLGTLYFYTTNRAEALDYYRRALACLPDDDRVSRAGLLSDLSAALRARSRFAEARDNLRQAVDTYHEIGDRIGEANALCGLSDVAQFLGDFGAAHSHGLRAVALGRESGDRSTEAYSQQSLGLAYSAMARYETALDHLSTALRLYREGNSRPYESFVLAQLGNALRGLGRHGESLEHSERGLSIAREIRYCNGECESHQAIGETLLACGRTAEAVDHLEQALELATLLEQPVAQARAHEALGSAVHDLGQPDEAREHRQQALDIYAGLSQES
jgi:DNA-binding SARP family transcriptional activator